MAHEQSTDVDDVQAQWERCRTAIADGVVEEIREAALALVATVDAREDLDFRRRAIFYYDAGIGLERLLEQGHAEVAPDAHRCQLRATELFREQVMSGEVDLSGAWADAVRSLAVIASRAPMAIDADSVNRIRAELDSARVTLAGSGVEAQLVSAYSSIATCLMDRHPAQRADGAAQDGGAVAALETALELDREGESSGSLASDHDRMVTRVNYCACLALGASTRERMHRLASACAEQAAWLVDAELDGLPLERDEDGPSGLDALLEPLLGAIGAYLRSAGGVEEGAWDARAFAAPALYALLPDIHEAAGATARLKAAATRPTEEKPGPLALLESLEVEALQITMKHEGDPDAWEAVESVLHLDPPPAPVYVVGALTGLGYEPEEIEDALRLLTVTENDLADDVATRWRLERQVGRFITAATSGSRAPLSDLVDHGEAAFDAGLSSEERLRLVAFLGMAGVEASTLWPIVDVRKLGSTLEAWADRLEQAGERRPVLDVVLAEAYLRLLRFGDPVGPELRRRARRVRAFIEAGGDLGHPAIASPRAEYFEALLNEARAIVTMRRQEGLDHECEEVDALRELAKEQLAAWDADDELRARVSSELEGLTPPDEIGEAAREFAAAAGGPDVEGIHRAAWRLLRAATTSSEAEDAETRSAVQQAIATVLDGRPPLHLTGYATLADLLEPRVANRLRIDDHKRLALFELAVTGEPPIAALPTLAILTMNAVGREDATTPVPPEAERLSERSAELTFSSRDAVAALGPDLCARLLAQRAFAGLNGGAGSLRELAHRADLACASLAVASVAESRSLVAISLYAVAELIRGLRVFPSAATLHDALASYIDDLGDDELPAPLRASIAADAAQLPSRPGAQPQGPDALGNATAALSGVGAGRRLDGDRFWQEVENLTRAIADAGLDDEIAAHRLLVALAAVRAFDRSGGEIRTEPLATLVRASLAVARSPRVPDSTLALPLLEHCVLGAMLAADLGLARTALRSFRATVNERAIASERESPLEMIETSGAIDQAATHAATEGEALLALEIAESGRTKLLIAVASGLIAPNHLALAHGPSDDPRDVGSVGGLPAEVQALLGGMAFAPTPNVVEEWREAMSGVDWVDVVVDIAVPWWPLAGAQEMSRKATPRPGSTGLAARRAALTDPSGTDIERASTKSLRTLWVLGTPDHQEVIGPLSSEAPEVEPDLVLVDCASEPRVTLDVAWTAWSAQAESHRIAEDILTGGGAWDSAARVPAFPSILPSVRFLDLDRDRATPELDVFVLADPTGDLGGAILEATAWAGHERPRTRIETGESATAEALFEALHTARTVVVGCHGFRTFDGGGALWLADQIVSHRDLLGLDGPLAAERLVLSCCWGGGRAVRQTRREALGLISSLLAMGLDEIVAPLDPVDDVAAGLFGCILARCVEAGSDLGRAVGAARVGLRDAGPEIRFDAWLSRLGGVASLDLDPDRAARLEQSIRQARLPLLQSETDSYGVFGAGRDTLKHHRLDRR